MLVVDDDPDLLDLLELELTAAGFTAMPAKSAEDALARVGDLRPDVVLSDVSMPGMSGVELCRELRERWPSLPVVLMTVEGTLERGVDAGRAGATRLLAKPLKPGSAPSVVDAALEVAAAEARMRASAQVDARTNLKPGHYAPGTRYRILRWLGEGGMGVVYDAVHIDIERRVALKVLHHELCQRRAVIDRFRAEARASSRIGSRYIAEVYDFVELPDGRLAFAMEYIEGETLIDLLDPVPMALERLIPIARQLCKGLQAAHDAEFVHRDVKPDNVMLTEADGRADAAKLLDFGVAYRRDDGGTASVVGTPGYCAPEQIMGDEVTPACDIYALGVTLYETACGRPPFESDDVYTLLRAHVEQDPPVLSQRLSTIPHAFSRVVMRCLEKKPEDRFASMRELEAALCEAQIAIGFSSVWDDLPLPDVDAAHKARLARKMPHRRGARRRRRIRLVAGLGIALLAGGVATATVGDDDDGVAAVVDDRVAALSRDAREAASRAMFVYPPVDEPTRPTALSLIGVLEGLDPVAFPDALRAAAALRLDFAAALARLGNRYWINDAARPFARDFYLQALAFDPDHAVARERVGLAPHAVLSFEARARQSEFTEAELIAVEPLVSLSNEEPVSQQTLREVETRRRSSRGARAAESLTRLIDTLPPAPLDVASDTPTEPSGTGVDETGQAELPAETAPLETAVAAQEVPPGVVPAADDSDPPLRREEQAAKATRIRRSLDAAAAAREAGERAKAEQHYHRALAVDSDRAEALAGLAEIAFARADYAVASRWFEKWVDAKPKSARAHLRLGDAYFKVHRYPDARDAYERAAALGSRGAKGRLEKLEARLGTDSAADVNGGQEPEASP